MAFGKLAFLSAIGLTAVVGLTGVIAGPGGVFRDSSAQTSGDVEVKGEVIDCPTGPDTQSEFELSGGTFEVVGLLVGLDATTVLVSGPSGDVGASLSPGVEIEGSPAAGDAVKVEGSVLSDGTFQARQVKPACAADADPVQPPVGDPSTSTPEPDANPVPKGDDNDNSGPGNSEQDDGDGDDHGGHDGHHHDGDHDDDGGHHGGGDHHDGNDD